MKTITRSVLVAFFVCGGILGASAQDQEQLNYIERNSDFTALKELAVKFDKEHQENYQKALLLATENGWPLTINKPDGGFSELVGVSADGRPRYYTTSNAESAITSRVNTLYPGGAAGLNLDGTGMLAGVWDAGKPRIDHVDLLDANGNPRITPGDPSTAVLQAHSTHVMGTILSSGINNPLAKGMAYKASGIWADWDNDKAEMALAVTKKGLLVSNHSYGLEAVHVAINEFGAYIQGSADLDDLLFKAPFYQPCWAAGNDRDQYQTYNSTKGGYDLLTEEATAKNVITVAAIEKVLSYTDATSVRMSVFSNWGPTDDLRIKPDISDKGVDVLSTLETSTKAYGTESGTSMATPGVVGTLVLLQQHYGNLNYPAFMRSATLRGLVAHTADEAGASAGPDSKFGWGLINAQRAAKAISDSKIQKSIINEMTLATGNSYTTTVVATGTEPLVATISWTDRAGTVNTNGGNIPVLVNDLDIRVTKDGVTYFPWRLLSNLNAAASNKADNTVDNLEKIEIPGAVAGTYTITVTHKKTLVGGTQDFSLIVTGITQAPLGIEESDFKAFNIWPNPANDLLNVSIQSDLSSDAYVTIYDIQGKRVVDQKLEASNAMFEGSLNIGSLTSGIYLVKVSQGDKQSVRKIIKE